MTNSSAPQTARTNIAKIVELEEAGEERRPRSDRAAALVGRFAGTLSFIAGQLTVVAAWVALNLGVVPGFSAFDPFPFSLLSTVLSLEGVLLAAFVLIRQNRMSAIAERRSHLDLQISLLSEKETTKVIQMLQRMSRHMGVEQNVSDGEAKELAEATAVEDLARELDDKLPADTRGRK
jgi:uncharacterized membrane protein